MNLITRKSWDPFQELNEMHNRLTSFLGRGHWPRGNGEEGITVADWSPVVDISEDSAGYLIHAELPGLKREEVQVTVEDGVLTIKGERKVEKEQKDKKFHRVERSYGSFVRSFSLPEGCDPAKVDAEFKDGVLNVHLAKGQKTQPKSIEIK